MNADERQGQDRVAADGFARVIDEIANRAMRQYFGDESPASVFDQLLGDLLELTQSPCGFIAEVISRDDGSALLRPWARSEELTAVTGDDASVSLSLRAPGSREARSLVSASTPISAEIVNETRSLESDTISSQPFVIESCMTLPLERGGELVGQIFVANRSGGYEPTEIETLAPLCTAVAHVMQAYRFDRERDETIIELERSERWTSSIVASLSDIVTVHDEDGGILFGNGAVRRLFGRADASGLDMSLVIFEEDLPKVTEAFNEVVEGRRAPTEAIEFRVTARDGSTRILEAHGENHLDNDAIQGVLVVARDITERRDAERRFREASAQLDVLVSSLNDAVLFVDDSDRIVFVNQAFCDLMRVGVAPDRIVGTTGREFLRAQVALSFRGDLDIDAILSDLYAQGKAARFEVQIRTGQSVEFNYLPANPEGGGERGHIWLCRDVTEIKDEQRRRALLLEQEREVRLSLESSNRSLQELADLKSEFVATVSHELRTPLTSVVSFTELLLDDTDNLTEEQLMFLQVIDRNAQRLLLLVGDLLMLARLESGGYSLDLAPVNLGEIVDHLLTSLAPQAAEAGVTLTSDVGDGPKLMADAARLEQVLINLVSNAIKFNREDGSVTVRARAADDEWRIEVIDTGIGIPVDEQAGLFERFFRASNTKEARMNGTGLGLVVCQVITELHGGTISLHSAEGEGTTVTVRLPVRPDQDR